MVTGYVVGRWIKLTSEGMHVQAFGVFENDCHGKMIGEFCPDEHGETMAKALCEHLNKLLA